MPPNTRLTISELQFRELLGHAQREAPLECCGLLAGRLCEGVAAATASFAIRNDAVSTCEYRTNARDLFVAFRAMRDRELELLAIYHSHPASPAVPSRRDLERNTYGEHVIHLIIGLAGSDIRAWRLRESDYTEVPVELVENGCSPLPFSGASGYVAES